MRKLEARNQVVGLDRRAPAHERATIHYRLGTFEDPSLKNWVRSFDVVIHLAGQSSAEVSMESPAEDAIDNYLSTLELCQILIDTKTGLLFASSMAAYGECGENEKNESSSVNPKSIYGLNKLASESIGLASPGSNFIPMRFLNVYGPGQNLSNMKQGMVSIFQAQIMQGETVEVKGSLERARNCIHVDDVLSAIELLLDSDKVHSPINVCSSKYLSVRTLLDKMKKVSNKKFTVSELGGTPGYILHSRGSNYKLQSLGWRQRLSLDQGLSGLNFDAE